LFGKCRLEIDSRSISLSVMESDITHLLNAAELGDAGAADQLLPLVYDELRRLASQRLAQEKPGQTLEATALVHEAYLRLVKVEQPQQWNGRGHFFAAAAEAMRRILVENARRKKRTKHGGDRKPQQLDPELVAAPEVSEDVLAIDEALTRLAAKEPVVAQVVQLRYFGGLTVKEAAETLGISPRTADMYWAYARSWLRAEVSGDRTP
jgi:RNA polymerase sigma factor (TIGR02999 family)